MRHWQRFKAIEYAKPVALAEGIALETDISISKARELLIAASNRVSNLLGFKSGTITLNRGLIQFKNFSGLLLLAPGMELEVAPKFLGDTPGWREDFFLLATLSHHGSILDNEGLRSGSRVTSDLSTLIGRSFVEMYWRNQRRPLRSYQRLQITDFAIDGEFNPEDLVGVSEYGYDQLVTSFTRKNPSNAVIRAAAAQLALIVSDVETRTRLERIAQHLPAQPTPMKLKSRRLPSRAAAWQPTYDLSLDILRGLGGTYDPKNAMAPGFVVGTWQVWEHLISISLRAALGGSNVSIQSKHNLGRRRSKGKSSPLNVFPDVLVSITTPEGVRRVLIDAKYKGHVERGALSVSNADIYESLAFSRAASIHEVILLYPRSADFTDSPANEVGYASEFSNITVDDVTIRAFELGVRGISRSGGLKRFVNALSEKVLGLEVL